MLVVVEIAKTTASASAPRPVVPMPCSLNVRKACFNPKLKTSTVVAKAATLHSRRARLSTVAALGFFKRRIATSGAVDDILAVVQATERGCRTSQSQRASIDAAVGVLEGAGNDGRPVSKSLSATWKLLWTTEKETLFILQNAGLFRTQAGNVYQVIDTDAQTLQNVITFPPDGAFVVQSKIEIPSNQRVQFEFVGASLKLRNRDIKLPPYGKGWFDTVYMDSKIRVSKDSRGDTLIVARDGPPRNMAS